MNLPPKMTILTLFLDIYPIRYSFELFGRGYRHLLPEVNGLVNLYTQYIVSPTNIYHFLGLNNLLSMNANQ